MPGSISTYRKIVSLNLDFKVVIDISNDKHTRRTFIKIAGFSLIGAFVALWYALTSRQLRLSGGDGFKKINLSGKPDGTYFFNTFIVTKKGASLTVLSNLCTHAGCKINLEHNGELVCGCHGSVYSSSGRAIKGPARKPLEPLSYYTDPVTGDITVRSSMAAK